MSDTHGGARAIHLSIPQMTNLPQSRLTGEYESLGMTSIRDISMPIIPPLGRITNPPRTTLAESWEGMKRTRQLDARALMLRAQTRVTKEIARADNLDALPAGRDNDVNRNNSE